ncbi:nuclear transport factor 2 family protein [Paraglaciecola aquimarina]|uniref:Nuclear transport factor 2 family protein n=1 Tax=Paraglaciecola aquimarina TaxID=1235557 RepID=A0ABU3SUX1_9ALTE|nr:nuclear transport factor 2 family protein [Paraglaciecola aquimarina]MDU0353804.1 nuclear transport factor 2 family protein [Paraglaciecola aquimarina]
MRDTELFDAVNTYFDALYYCDVKLLDKVFHESSSLFDVDEGKLLVDPIASFRQDVASRPSPASVNQPRQQEIILVDWLSQNCATVKVRLRAHNNIFVDHLSFVKDADGWCIVSKVWHLESTI